jgi:hypothetical protein
MGNSDTPIKYNGEGLRLTGIKNIIPANFICTVSNIKSTAKEDNYFSIVSAKSASDIENDFGKAAGFNFIR